MQDPHFNTKYQKQCKSDGDIWAGLYFVLRWEGSSNGCGCGSLWLRRLRLGRFNISVFCIYKLKISNHPWAQSRFCSSQTDLQIHTKKFFKNISFCWLSHVNIHNYVIPRNRQVLTTQTIQTQHITTNLIFFDSWSFTSDSTNLQYIGEVCCC